MSDISFSKFFSYVSLTLPFLTEESLCFIFDLLLMSPKFQKRSALKLAGRIIPRAKLSGTIKRINNIPKLALGFPRIFIRPMPDSFAKLYERLIPAAILF